MTRKATAQLAAVASRNPQSSSPYGAVNFVKNATVGMGWEGRQAGELKLMIAAVTANGHALMFAQTRNGGLSLTLYSDGDPVKLRMYDVEEADTVIGQVTESALRLLPPEVQTAVCEASAE